MHMGHPEQGDVFMLETGELVVYDARTHRVRRQWCHPVAQVWNEWSHDLTLSDDGMKRLGKPLGTIDGLCDGLTRLCRLPPFPPDRDRWLVIANNQVKFAKVYDSYADAKWAVDHAERPAIYSVVCVRAVDR